MHVAYGNPPKSYNSIIEDAIIDTKIKQNHLQSPHHTGDCSDYCNYNNLHLVLLLLVLLLRKMDE